MRQGFEAVGGDGGARPQACSPEPGSISQLVHEPPQALGPGPRTWDIFLLAVSPPWSPVGISDFTWSKPDCGSFSPNLSLLETPPHMRPRHPPNGHHLAISRQSAAALVPKLHEPPCSLHPHHYRNPPELMPQTPERILPHGALRVTFLKVKLRLSLAQNLPRPSRCPQNKIETSLWFGIQGPADLSDFSLNLQLP